MTDRFRKFQEEETDPINSTSWVDVLSGTKNEIVPEPHTIWWSAEWNGNNTNYGVILRAILIRPDTPTPTTIVLGRQQLPPRHSSAWETWSSMRPLTASEIATTNPADQDGDYTFKIQARVEDAQLTVKCRRRGVFVRQK